jgi:hypothetical protein
MIRTVVGFLLCLGGLVAGPVRAGEAENLERLEALPRPQRQRLAENLRRFDGLDADGRRAVQQIDEQLAALPAEDRQRYQKLMHRYHLWAQGLSTQQRQDLQAAPPAQRLDLIKRLRAEQRQARDPRLETVWIRSAAFNPFSLFEVSYLIKVWLALGPKEQAEIDAMDLPARILRLERLGQDRGLSRERPGRAELEELRSQIERGLPVRDGVLSRKELDELKRPLDGLPTLKAPLAVKKMQARSGLVRRLETLYFRQHEPAPVAPQRLGWFEEALPSWLDEMIDPLPPDSARRRLTILYRLVFPLPEEIPAPRPQRPNPAASPPSGQPSGSPAAGPPAEGSTPF